MLTWLAHVRASIELDYKDSCAYLFDGNNGYEQTEHLKMDPHTNSNLAPICPIRVGVAI